MKNSYLIEPSFHNNDSCIVFCSDNGFIHYVSVAIQSIIDHAIPERLYDIVILHSRIDVSNQQLIEKMSEGFSNIAIRFYNIENYVKGHSFFTKNRQSLSQEAYYRLFIPWVLSDSYSKALYLDGDMLIRRDISDLLDINIGNNLIAAVRDYWGICNCYIPNDPTRSYRINIGLTEIDSYVISATLLFNLREFRDKYNLDEVIRLIESKQWKQHDQDVINILCKGKTLFLSPIWGFMCCLKILYYLPEYLQLDFQVAEDISAIYHFAGNRKPFFHNYTKYVMEFWETADKTPFFPNLANKIMSPTLKNIVLKRLSKVVLEKNSSNSKIDYYKQVKLPDDTVQYNFFDIQNGVLQLEGNISFYTTSIESHITILLNINHKLIAPTWVKNGDEYQNEEIKNTYRKELFRFDIPLNKETKIYTIGISCIIDGIRHNNYNQLFGINFPINENNITSYCKKDFWILTKKNNHLELRLCSSFYWIKKEWLYLKEVWNTNKKETRKAIFLRLLYYLLHWIVRKPVWLISDNLSSANDNGGALFRYLNENHKKDIYLYFVIQKDSPDYNKIKQYGKVLYEKSWGHKIIRLLTTVNISSQNNSVFLSPFAYDYPYKDILSKSKFVILQHGILYSEAFSWLCLRNQQFDGLEENVIQNNEKEECVHTSNLLWLKDMPRFDLLEDNAQKIVTIMPSWRKYLSLYQNPIEGDWSVRRDFSGSIYAKFYRSLLHHQKLNHRARELGYKIQFKINSAFRTQTEEFGFKPEVNIVTNNISYQNIFENSSLIVTDYMLSVVDFAYMRKPVVYCQFDKKEFLSSHICNYNYFDYEQEGFGEVEYNLEHTVDRIIEYMENGCKLKDKYRERINRFFENNCNNDKNNCERVYEHIIAMD